MSGASSELRACTWLKPANAILPAGMLNCSISSRIRLLMCWTDCWMPASSRTFTKSAGGRKRLCQCLAGHTLAHHGVIESEPDMSVNYVAQSSLQQCHVHTMHATHERLHSARSPRCRMSNQAVIRAPPSAVMLRSGAVGTAGTGTQVMELACRSAAACGTSQTLHCQRCRQAQQWTLTDETDVRHLQLLPEVGEPCARILCP
jgi:hypothetical protein